MSERICVFFVFLHRLWLLRASCGNVRVSADWKVLKNRKFLGSVREQNIRTKSRPVIQEMQPQYVFLNLSEQTALRWDS